MSNMPKPANEKVTWNIEMKLAFSFQWQIFLNGCGVLIQAKAFVNTLHWYAEKTKLNPCFKTLAVDGIVGQTEILRLDRAARLE